MLVAEAVYVTVAAAWQRVELAPIEKLVGPTNGLVVTVCVELCGPLQPAALAVIIDVPFHNDE